MAFVYPEAICPLCRSPLGDISDVVASSHFIADATDPLLPYSDEAMHKNCFLRWPMREAFIERYNETSPPNERGMTHVMRSDGSVDRVPVTSPGRIRTPREMSQLGHFSERRPGIFVGNFFDRDSWNHKIVVSLRSTLTGAEIRETVARMVKVCALPRYRDVAAGAAGTRLLPRPTSFAPDRTEFELERSGDDWEQIAKLKNFVLVIPIDSNLTDPHLRSIHREKV